MTQTWESSSATASQMCASAARPSKPRSSPAIWKPVTCSRPSSDVVRVLKNPERTAYSPSKGSPVRNNDAPLYTRIRLATSPSRRTSSAWLKPTGRHRSRSPQFEHATLKADRESAASTHSLVGMTRGYVLICAIVRAASTPTLAIHQSAGAVTSSVRADRSGWLGGGVDEKCLDDQTAPLLGGERRIQ